MSGHHPWPPPSKQFDDAESDELLVRLIQRRANRLAALVADGAPRVIVDAEWLLLSRSYYRMKELQARQDFAEIDQEVKHVK